MKKKDVIFASRLFNTFKMRKILGIGNALVDIMTLLENDSHLDTIKLPKGSMQLVEKNEINTLLEASSHLPMQKASGGSAANTIRGIAHLGLETGYIGKIGTDDFGRFFHSDLQATSATPHLLTGESETGRALAFVSKDTERTFATYLGAAVELHPNDLKESLIAHYDFLHIEGYLLFNHELIIRALELAKKNHLMVALDLASYNVVEANRDFLNDIIHRYVDIVFANEEEAKAFVNDEPETALHKIAEMVEISVVKLGKKGSMVKTGKEMYKTGIIEANAIDTTGAGDLYAGGFLYGLATHKPLDQCARYGAILSGKVVETIGTKIDNNTWQTIRTKIQ